MDKDGTFTDGDITRQREAEDDALRDDLSLEDRAWRSLVRHAEAFDELCTGRPWKRQRKPKVALRRRLACYGILDQAERESRD